MEQALYEYQSSLEIARELGHKRGIAMTLGQLANLADDKKDFGEAECLYQQSRQLFDELDDPAGISLCCYSLALLYKQQNRFLEAASLLERVLKIVTALGHPTVEQTRRMLMQIHARLSTVQE